VNGRLAITHQYTFVSHNGCSVIDYLVTCDNDLSQLNKFCIDRFTEWSDHAPLSFSLRCNNVCTLNLDHEEIKFKWDVNLREQFRWGVVENLNKLNKIVYNDNFLSRDSVNNMLNDFTITIRSFADPLFTKRCQYKQRVCYDDNFVNNKNWFDSDCITARNTYRRALSQFNLMQPDENRIFLCECKRQYKGIIRKKMKIKKIK